MQNIISNISYIKNNINYNKKINTGDLVGLTCQLQKLKELDSKIIGLNNTLDILLSHTQDFKTLSKLSAMDLSLNLEVIEIRIQDFLNKLDANVLTFDEQPTTYTYNTSHLNGTKPEHKPVIQDHLETDNYQSKENSNKKPPLFSQDSSILENPKKFNLSDFLHKLESFANEYEEKSKNSPTVQLASENMDKKNLIVYFSNKFREFHWQYEDKEKFIQQIMDSYNNNHMMARTMSYKQGDKLQGSKNDDSIIHANSGQVISLKIIERNALSSIEERQKNKLYDYSASMIGKEYPKMYSMQDKISFVMPALPPELNDILNEKFMTPDFSLEFRRFLEEQMVTFTEYAECDLMSEVDVFRDPDDGIKDIVASAIRRGVYHDGQRQPPVKSEQFFYNFYNKIPKREHYPFGEIETIAPYNEMITSGGIVMINKGCMAVNYENNWLTVLSIMRNSDKFDLFCSDHRLINSYCPIVEFIRKEDNVALNPLTWDELHKLQKIYKNKKDILEGIHANIPSEWFLKNPDFTQNELWEVLHSPNIQRFSNDSPFLEEYQPIKQRNNKFSEIENKPENKPWTDYIENHNEQRNLSDTINEIISVYCNSKYNAFGENSVIHGNGHIKTVCMIANDLIDLYKKYVGNQVTTFLKSDQQYLILIAVAFHDSGRVCEGEDDDELSSCLLCISYLVENKLCDPTTALKLSICIALKDNRSVNNHNFKKLEDFFKVDFKDKADLDKKIDSLNRLFDNSGPIDDLKKEKLKKLLNFEAIKAVQTEYIKNKTEINSFVENDLENELTIHAIADADSFDIVRVCGKDRFDSRRTMYSKIFSENSMPFQEFNKLQQEWAEKRDLHVFENYERNQMKNDFDKKFNNQKLVLY